MTPEVCQQIASLLGQRPLSELPFGDNSPVTGEYVVYKQGNSNIYRIASTDIYTYFCRKVFWFVFDEMNPQPEDGFSCIVLNPQRYIQPGDTPITYARRLLDVVNNPNEEWTGRWIGDPAPENGGTNISQEWFKHFQYYYFDNLNNRQRTMLLNYGDGTMVNKQFDILIWIDASTSMVPEISNLTESIKDLCSIIFSQNPNNRISIVQFCGHGYDSFEGETEPDKSKRQCRHLAFTSNIDDIQIFMTALCHHQMVPGTQNSDRKKHYAWGDENLWYVSHLADPNFVYHHGTPYDPDETDREYPDTDARVPEDSPGLPSETEPYNADWNPNWSTDGWTVGWSTNPDVQKLFVIISDESCDTYVSVTGQLKVPYKKDWKSNTTPMYKEWGTTEKITQDWLNENHITKSADGIYHDLDIVESAADFSNPNTYWGPYIVPPVYRKSENDKAPFTDGPPGGLLIGETDHWQWDLGGGDGSLNNDRRAPWGMSWGQSLLNLGYKRSGEGAHTVERWCKTFRDNNVKVFYLETNDDKWMWEIREKDPITGQIAGASRSFNGQIVRCGLKWIQAYNYLIQKELLDPIGGELHSIQPTEVATTLADIFRNEAVAGDDSLWSNSMWASHLDSNTIQNLPSVVTKEGQLKKLYVPHTAIVANPTGTVDDPDNFIWDRFDKRNYTKIVTGGWDAGNEHDESWASIGTATVEPSPEVNDDIVDGRGEVVARNIGDIDQTLKVIGEFIDDVMLSIKPMEHTGQVVFTASTETNPLGIWWRNVISSDSDNESFVWSGNDSLRGENTNLVPGIPNHHHNTVFNGSNATPIQNVSVVGRPEGETVGGVAKVDTAERLPTASYGKKEDTVHRLSNPGPALSGRGAYTGTVEYDAYEVGTNQQAHNNMPLYYKMRAFVHD